MGLIEFTSINANVANAANRALAARVEALKRQRQRTKPTSRRAKKAVEIRTCSYCSADAVNQCTRTGCEEWVCSVHSRLCETCSVGVMCYCPGEERVPASDYEAASCWKRCKVCNKLCCDNCSSKANDGKPEFGTRTGNYTLCGDRECARAYDNDADTLCDHV